MDKISHILQFDIRSTKKSIIILMTVYVIFGFYYGITIRDLGVIPFTIMIWMTMLTGLPFQLNGKYGFNYLMVTFPVKRKNMIAGRYLYSLLFGAIGLSLTEIIICILAGFFQIGMNRRLIYLTLCLAILLYFVIISIYLPLYFWLTYNTLLYMSPVFIFFLYVLLQQLYYFGLLEVNVDNVVTTLWGAFPIVVAITVLMPVLLIMGSYYLSCKFYINKDLLRI